MKQFFSQLNARQLILQFIAMMLVTFSLHVLASLYDYEFLYTKGTIPSFMYGERHERDIRIINFAGSMGQIILFLCFWRIASKRSWYWLNAVIVFVAAFVLNNFNFLGWSVFRDALLLPGSIFGVNTKAGVVINGTIMLAVALWLTFGKAVLRFIDNGVNKNSATRHIGIDARQQKK